MKRVIIVTVLSLALTGTSFLGAASGQTTTGKDSKIGTRVTITGCLHEGKSRNTFVLLGVTERPADSPPTQVQLAPYAIYWLDSTDGLKTLVGEIVDVTGKVTDRRPNTGMITVSVDASEALATDVQVASNSKTLDATTKNFDNKPPTAAPPKSDSVLEVTRPVYKLKVETVQAVGARGAGPACK